MSGAKEGRRWKIEDTPPVENDVWSDT